MPTVRAKFTVAEKITRPAGKKPDGTPIIQTDVRLTPVYGNSPENKAFFASTPTGGIVLGTVNQEAADRLILGGEFYVDFTPAE